jgi:hypothetical protein
MTTSLDCRALLLAATLLLAPLATLAQDPSQAPSATPFAGLLGQPADAANATAGGLPVSPDAVGYCLPASQPHVHDQTQHTLLQGHTHHSTASMQHCGALQPCVCICPPNNCLK